MFTDPTGMEQDGVDHDYKLRKNGKIELLRETNDKTHTIYNKKNNETLTFDKKDIVGNNKYLKNSLLGKEETISSSGIQLIQFNHPESSEDFYRYAAQNSDVEFGKFDGYFGSKYGGFVFSENNPNQINNGILANQLSKLDFENSRFSHSHPNGTQHPSGYHGVKSLERIYLQPNFNRNSGDRNNSKYINLIKGFENIIHEMYSPVHKTFTKYYGDERASNPSKSSVFY